MQNSQNSDLDANNKDNNKVDLSDCYSFTYSDKELKRDKNLPYFEEIKSLIPMTENVAKKIQMMRQRLEEKKVEIQQKINENKSKNQISQKNIAFYFRKKTSKLNPTRFHKELQNDFYLFFLQKCQG